MSSLPPRFCVAIGLMLGLSGCSGDYHVYERASASGFSTEPAADSPAPMADAAAPIADPAAGAGAPAADGTGGLGVPAPDNAVPADAATGLQTDAPAANSGTVLAAPLPGNPAPDSWDTAAQPAPAVPPASSGMAALPPPVVAGAPDSGPPPSAQSAALDPSLVRLANSGGPVRLEIPSIGVDSAVERVGLTPEPERAMDAPKGFMNVGWYEKGFQPGEAGNAVIAGHLDTSTGGPAVFWDLDKVNPGDEVYVTYANGDRYTFVVEDWELYDHNAQGPIIDSIFGKSQSSDLNLVTCDGAWDHGAATYSKRLVVFTTLVAEATELAGE